VNKPMRTSILYLSIFLLLLSRAGYAQAPEAMPALPTDFDSSVKPPPNLPAKLDIPANTRIEVKAWRKKPLPPPLLPLAPDNPRFLWAPDLESAVIERNEQDIHAVFHWQGGRSNEAFVIRNLCFTKPTFAYPNLVTVTGSVLNLRLNGQSQGAGASGDFPGIDWYSPAAFAGKASFNGSSVLVFTPGGKKAAADSFPAGEYVCLDSKSLLPVLLDNGFFIYTFTTSPALDVQIDPQGLYQEAMKKQFGHYP